MKISYLNKFNEQPYSLILKKYFYPTYLEISPVKLLFHVASRLPNFFN